LQNRTLDPILPMDILTLMQFTRIITIAPIDITKPR
jgi:hypothetical protein